MGLQRCQTRLSDQTTPIRMCSLRKRGEALLFLLDSPIPRANVDVGDMKLFDE